MLWLTAFSQRLLGRVPKGVEDLRRVGMQASRYEDLELTCDLPADCIGSSLKYKNLQVFWFGKAQELLHELMHTKYFKSGGDGTVDYAYGGPKMPKSRCRISHA